MRTFSKISSFISSVILKFFYLLEFFLFLRLLLTFLGANPKTIVVSWIYQYSDTLISPFNSIFNDLFWQGRLIETAVVSTMIGYAIVVFIILRLFKVIDKT